ncbi:MAG: hypothetical protein M3P82_04035 [Bacteroidota bacterium]|nr:hypothetical protein [Bacteroidota bacterium]
MKIPESDISKNKPGDKKKSLNNWIVSGLIMSFLISLAGSFFPYQSNIQTMLFKIDALFAIAAFACLGSKATSENSDIAAAGFNVIAIAQGLFLAEVDNPGHWNYETATTAALFMIPSFLMISYYTKFPTWLRTAGIVMTVPFIILVILRNFVDLEKMSLVESIVYLSYQLITLCWAWQIWKENKI